MLIKYNNHLLYSDKCGDIVYFHLCQQSFFTIKIDYCSEEFEVTYYRTLFEYLNNLFSFFIIYDAFDEDFELYYCDEQKSVSTYFIGFYKEQYSNLSDLFLKIYNEYQI